MIKNKYIYDFHTLNYYKTFFWNQTYHKKPGWNFMVGSIWFEHRKLLKVRHLLSPLIVS